MLVRTQKYQILQLENHLHQLLLEPNATSQCLFELKLIDWSNQQSYPKLIYLFIYYQRASSKVFGVEFICLEASQVIIFIFPCKPIWVVLIYKLIDSTDESTQGSPNHISISDITVKGLWIKIGILLRFSFVLHDLWLLFGYQLPCIQENG